MAFMSCKYMLAIVQFLALSPSANGYPGLLQDIRERQINIGDVAASYDYIVVGGGQSGLVIANRLSEDTTKTVLIVEYGYLDNDPSQIEPSSATRYPPRDLFNVTAVAQTAINNKRPSVYAASVVGGGSTVNGMLFDRGAAEDYDNWAKLGNTGWDWAGLYPYFKKSTKFTPPSAQLAQENNITWDASAYGNGNINVTYPPWVWPTIKVQFAAWNEVGVTRTFEHADGHAYGALWVPSNVDPVRITRSYARNGYFDPARNRPNLKLLVGYRVNEVQFSADKRAESVTIQQRGTPNADAIRTVKANKEIILCAGWLHTPHILQRSGIGPRALLTQANIPVLVDLPGVGSNLQDHPVASVNFNYQSNLQPNPSTSQTNQTFAQWAQQQWTNNRSGPLSLTTGNNMAIVPAPIFHPGYQSSITKLRGQNAASYLPTSYNTDNVKGFVAQRDVLIDSLSSLTNGFTEITFAGGGGNAILLEKQFSRGTVLLTPADKYAEPTVDYQTNINPVDQDLFVAMVKFYRKWMAAPSMQQLGPQEVSPGTSVSTDAQIASWIASSVSSTTAHTCCTAAMGKRDEGGVLSPDLLVWGVTGLSVGDISLMPLIPATHTCATVYAIAEKAADLIKARAGSDTSSSSSSGIQMSTSSSTTASESLSTTTVATTTVSSTPSTTAVVTTSTTVSRSTTRSATTTQPAPQQTHWGQCAGNGYTGPKVCQSPYTCKYSNDWYSQCL